MQTGNLGEILQLKVLSSSPRIRTIFDISGYPHYENVLSNWYVYFLDKHEDHGLGDIFIKTLAELIQQKSKKEFEINIFSVEKEVRTDDGKRIDIVIEGREIDAGKYIVIENKIYHWLHNDLGKYWVHYKSPEEKKVGVLLTLTKQEIPVSASNSFINILHKEWALRIKKQADLRLLEAKQRVYISEFCTAIINLSKDLIMNDQVKFYFDHVKIINDAVAAREAALEYILGQLQSAAQKLEYTLGGRANEYRYFYVPGFEFVYYTIIIDELMDETKKIIIVIELFKKGLEKRAILDQLLKEKIEAAELLHCREEQRGLWLHYVKKEYELTMNDLRNLDLFVIDSIKKDFSEIMATTLEVLADQTHT